MASSGTSALQDRATGLVPSFPEWLKVFFEDCGNENEFVDSEKTFTEVSKTSHVEANLTKKSIVVKVPTSSTLPPNYSSELKALRVNHSILNIARQRSSKSPSLKVGRLQNHDFYSIFDSGHRGLSWRIFGELGHERVTRPSHETSTIVSGMAQSSF